MRRRADLGRDGRPLRLVGAVAVLLLSTVAVRPAAADDRELPGRVLFGFADEEVFESSGLVDRGSVVYTTNDSGDDAVLYGVQARTGETVSRTSYAEDVDDVEALAPGRAGTVWVGDVGDNRRRRDDVVAYRVRPVDGELPAPAYRLAYPDGPHDAETLLARPGGERLFVVTKSAFGGTVYAAPPRLSASGVNRLRAFAQVRGLVTDGAFLPGGRRVVLRTYGNASVYTFPAFQLVGSVRLPFQLQGEGISVGRDGRVLISSEGVRAEVLSVRLPTSLTRGPLPDGGSGSGLPEKPVPAQRPDDSGPARTPWDWVGIALVAAGIAAVGYVAARPPGRRTR